MAKKSNYIVRGGADFSGIKVEMLKTQAAFKGFQTSITKSVNTVGKILGSIAVGKLIKDSTAVAMGVESAMDNINRNMGNSAKSFQKWVNVQSKALGMGKAEAYKYGSTFSNLLGSFQKDEQQTADSTQELMKAAAIISSKTGRTYEDTANRIRSGMLGSTEAIEDLGVYTNISMMQSTAAFKKFAGSKSWAQLDFQTQQQIRLAAILEQTYDRYGDTLADTTTTRQNQFVASLKNAQLALGQAFLPIYNAVLPALTRMADALGSVVNKIAQFTQALFGKANVGAVQNTEEQAIAVSDLGDATEKAGKQAKKSLAGFDELNVLGGKDKEATTGGTATVGIATVDDGTEGAFGQVSESAQKMATKVKEAFADMKSAISENKEVIINTLTGISAALITFEIVKNWPTIVSAVTGAFTALQTAVAAINAPILLISAAIGLLIFNIMELWRKNEGFRNSVINVWNSIKSGIVTIALGIWEEVKSVWDKYGQTLIDNLHAFMESIQKLIFTVWNVVIEPIITNALSMLAWLWEKHLKGVVEQLGIFIMSLANGILEIWNVFFAPFIGWLIETLGPYFVATINFMVDKFGTFVGIMADVTKGLLKVLGGIVDFIAGVFTGNWKKAWNGVVNVFKGIVEIISGIFKGVLNLTIDVINAAIQRVIGAINGLIQGAISIINKTPGVDIKLNPIDVPKIPKLATGAVIPPNSEFLAILGDQRSGTNIETPERLLRQIMREELGGSVQQQIPNVEVPIYFDSDIIGRAVVTWIEQQVNRTGELPFSLGNI